MKKKEERNYYIFILLFIIIIIIHWKTIHWNRCHVSCFLVFHSILLTITKYLLSLFCAKPFVQKLVSYLFSLKRQIKLMQVEYSPTKYSKKKKLQWSSVIASCILDLQLNAHWDLIKCERQNWFPNVIFLHVFHKWRENILLIECKSKLMPFIY